jgi:mRNA interferase RelE/StbE
MKSMQLATHDIYCHNDFMFEVRVTEVAQRDFLVLPLPIQTRVLQVFERLRCWPAVSGAKPLRGDLKGAYRIRVGDWRVLFTVARLPREVTVFRIANRRDVYE